MGLDCWKIEGILGELRLCGLLMEQVPTASDSSGLSQIFKNLWQCCVPRKVSAFSWQVVLDRLPTRANQLMRGVLLDIAQAVCIICGLVQESAGHLFITCLFVI